MGSVENGSHQIFDAIEHHRKATTEVVITKKARSEGFSPQTRTVDIKLTQFLPSLAEVPSKELEAIKERAIKSGFDFIDFWAVDFNWQPDKPFTHDINLADYRTPTPAPTITALS